MKKQNIDKNSIGGKIAACRLSRNLSLQALSESSGCSEELIYGKDTFRLQEGDSLVPHEVRAAKGRDTPI